jgi:hypothetical protein
VVGFAFGFQFPILAISAILAIFCIPLPASFSQNPTRHRRFVANKHQTSIRPSGDRTVEAHISLFSALFLQRITMLFFYFSTMSGRGSQLFSTPHPPFFGTFVANTRQSAIR